MCSHKNRLIEAILMSTHKIPKSIKKKKKKKKENHPKSNTIVSAAMGLLLRTQGRVRNSRGKRAINIRATEVLLYIQLLFAWLIGQHLSSSCMITHPY